MLVRQIPVGPMQNFVYLLADEGTREAMAIDSGWETGPIVKRAQEDGMKVKFVVSTHNHFDHSETLQELASKLGAKVVAHELSPVPHDVSVRDGDVLDLGGNEVRVLYTPGHTDDSICLYDGRNLFTGDTLFMGNVGRVDLEGGSPEKLFGSLHKVILALPRETVIYPGHDYGDVPSRELGEEERLNPALSAKTYQEFFAVP